MSTPRTTTAIARAGPETCGHPDSGDIATAKATDLTAARIRRRRILGELIHEYEWAA